MKEAGLEKNMNELQREKDCQEKLASNDGVGSGRHYRTLQEGLLIPHVEVIYMKTKVTSNKSVIRKPKTSC